MPAKSAQLNLFTTPELMTPLARLKKSFRAAVDQHGSVSCPICERPYNRNHRSLYGSMAVSLIAIYDYYAANGWDAPPLKVQDYLHQALPKLMASAAKGGDYAKLTVWPLIVAVDGERADGSKRIGYFKITQLGIDFVERKVAVHSRFWEWPGSRRVLDTSSPKIYIDEALGEKFDYASLMAWRPARGNQP